MTIEQQTAQALKWSVLGKALTQALSWVITLAVMRLLAPADYGLVAIVSALIAVLANFAELGLGASIVQAKDLSDTDLRRLTGLVVLLNLLVGVVVLVAAPLLATFYDNDELASLIRLASLHFVFTAMLTVPQALAYRNLEFKRLAIVDVAAATVSSLVTLVLAWAGFGAYSLMIGSIVLSGVRAVLLFRRESMRMAFSAKGIGKLVTFGGVLTVNRVVTQFVGQTDVMIGASNLSSSALGIYSVSLHVATLPMQKIMGTINQIAFSAVARLQDDVERLRSRMLTATRLLALVAIPTLWGIAATAPESVPTLLGVQWQDAVFPLQIVGLITPLRMLQMVFNTAASGMGGIGLVSISTVISAIVFPIAFYVGCHWGADGLALSWVMAVPVVFATTTPRMARLLGISLLDLLRSSWSPLMAGATMYVIIWLARPYLLHWATGERFVALVVLGGAAYLATGLAVDRRIVADVRSVAKALRGD